MTTLVTLPPYLVDRIRSVVKSEGELLDDIGQNVSIALEDAAKRGSTGSPLSTRKERNGDLMAEGDKADEEEIAQNNIDMEVLEKLSRWAMSDAGSEKLKEKNMGTPFLQPACAGSVSHCSRSFTVLPRIPLSWHTDLHATKTACPTHLFPKSRSSQSAFPLLLTPSNKAHPG